jgi:3-dehydroquinate synthase
MLPAGERYKTLASVQRIWRWLFANGVDRSSPVVCLGGGVVGDLGGFAAATALRGIPVVQVATTLVAQVDSAIGGKTGFNTPEGKNLIGGFYPPSVVLVDPELLRSLPPRELTAGMGEVVKYAAIADAALFARLEAQGSGIFSDIGLLVEAIRRCIQIKAAVVGKDPKEYGLRVILNFGHTVGHALEAASRYRLLHGEAVAIGMAVETSLAVSRGLCSEKDRRRLVALLDTLGLPTQSRSELSASRFLRLDKKRAGTTVRIPLLRRIGRV